MFCSASFTRESKKAHDLATKQAHQHGHSTAYVEADYNSTVMEAMLIREVC